MLLSPKPELESAAETVAAAFDVETEPEVTEAVARMADDLAAAMAETQ